MTASISPLVSSPLNAFWVCVACGKIGNASDLIAHTGNKVNCIFHRSRFSNSAGILSGKCIGCDASLHGAIILCSKTIKRI